MYYINERLAFSPNLDASVDDERAQPHAHSNQVQQEGHSARLPLRLHAASRGRTRPGGTHEATEGMYRAQGQ